MVSSPHIPKDLFTLPRTREEAKRTGAKYYFTNRPCENGHIAARSKGNATCQACSNERMARKWKEGAAQRTADREHGSELRHLFRGSDDLAARENRIEQIGIEAVLVEEAAAEEAKKELARAKGKQARLVRMAEEGTEIVRAGDAAGGRQAYWSNPEFHRARRRERTRKGTAGYRMIRLRTPPWLTDEERSQIDLMYELRIDDEVDHFVPIDDHPDLVGLHVPWNLRHLPVAKNRQRSRGRVNEFSPCPQEVETYVAYGMAIWKRDLADDGTIDWSKHPRPLVLPSRGEFFV